MCLCVNLSTGIFDNQFTRVKNREKDKSLASKIHQKQALQVAHFLSLLIKVRAFSIVENETMSSGFETIPTKNSIIQLSPSILHERRILLSLDLHGLQPSEISFF